MESTFKWPEVKVGEEDHSGRPVVIGVVGCVRLEELEASMTCIAQNGRPAPSY